MTAPKRWHPEWCAGWPACSAYPIDDAEPYHRSALLAVPADDDPMHIATGVHLFGDPSHPGGALMVEMSTLELPLTVPFWRHEPLNHQCLSLTIPEVLALRSHLDFLLRAAGVIQ